jgi:hypothetical protein
MVLSNDETSNLLGILRLGFVALLAPLWLLGGLALIWLGETLLGVGSIVIGLVVLGGGYRLYRAIERPDVVVDEWVRETQYRAGYNAFWTMVLVSSCYVAFGMFLPSAVTERVAAWGGFELAWPVALALGFAAYIGSLAYYRFHGI